MIVSNLNVRIIYLILLPTALLLNPHAKADSQQDNLPSQTLFTNVHVWDGTSDGVTKRINVLVEDNLVKKLRASESDIHAEANVINAEGKIIEPDTPNGVKVEQFVFDALPVARNSIVVESAREDEFSPVKNAEGKDSPKTCHEDQLRMFARWLTAAGETIETDENGLPKLSFEISPLFAVDEADFVAHYASLDQKITISEGTIIE